MAEVKKSAESHCGCFADSPFGLEGVLVGPGGVPSLAFLAALGLVNFPSVLLAVARRAHVCRRR